MRLNSAPQTANLPLRVLFLMEDLCFGGTQKQNLELACRLDRKLFDPVMLTLTGPADLDAQAVNAGVPVVHMGGNRNVAPLFFARLGAQIVKIRPQIIVTCTALPNIWGRIWGRLMHVPVIVGTCRGGGAPWRQHEWLLWRLANGIVCNSPQLVEAMAKRGAPLANLRYIANGVDTEHFSPGICKSGDPLIVCVARLAKDKDHKTLLRAFAKVCEQIPAARLSLVGEGPEEQSLRHFCAAALPEHAAGRVEFAGARADPAPCLRAASVFALASIREGQPNAILEAMACGLPVCATDAGGIPALVTNNGLLCKPADPDALANNLLKLLRDETAARAMGEKGRLRCESGFSFLTMVQKHQDFFMELWHKYGAHIK